MALGINRRVDAYNRRIERQLVAASTLAVSTPLIIPTALYAVGYLFSDQISDILRK